MNFMLIISEIQVKKSSKTKMHLTKTDMGVQNLNIPVSIK